MVLAEATPDGFKEKGRFAQPHRSQMPAWSVPVIARRRLFLRDQQVLLCYDLRQKTTAQPKAKHGAKSVSRQPDAVFVPSPPEVVAKMLEMAGVSKADVVYDLGCGDGRVVVAAAKNYGARGVGIELDATLVRQAREEAHKQGVQGLVTIQEGDLFEADLGGTTVIALYLLPRLNAKLLPKLKGLKSGTRVVSHAFPLPGIQPDKVACFPSADHLTEHTVYLYVAPLRPKGGMD
jgi:SAM-dependent methyltransferase